MPETAPQLEVRRKDVIYTHDKRTYSKVWLGDNPPCLMIEDAASKRVTYMTKEATFEMCTKLMDKMRRFPKEASLEPALQPH